MSSPLPLPNRSVPATATLRRLLPVIGLLVAALGGWLGYVIRYELIEPVARAAACVDVPAPWWCLARDTLRIAAQNSVIAGAAVIAALAGCLYKDKEATVGIMVAMFLGGMGIYLYSTAVAVVAVTLALIRAASLVRT